MDEVSRTLLDKKMDNYCTHVYDFQCENDIMVTITLHEYRDLVTGNATASERIRKAESDRYERNKEIEELENKITILQNNIIKLTTDKFGYSEDTDV